MRTLGILLAVLGCDTSALDRFHPAPDASGDGGNPDFSLSTSAPFVMVRQGAIQTMTVNVSRHGGFNQSLIVGVNGLPSGVTIDPLTIAGDATSGTLTVHAANSASQGGPTILTITGNGAAASRSTNLDLVVAGAPGTPDLSFGTGGKVMTMAGMGAVFTDLVLQPDRKIVASGAIIAACFSQIQFGAYRYDPDGSLDAGFGAGGRATFGLQAQSMPGAMALQMDGRLVLAGAAGPFNGPYDWTIVRFTSDGSIDTSFGNGGATRLSFGNTNAQATSVVVQEDGRILVVGNAPGGFVAARFLPDGTADTSFGGGVIVTPVGSMTMDKSAAVRLDQDRFVVAGSSQDAAGSRFAFTRHNQSDGSLDRTFGNAGILRSAVDGFLTAFTLYPDGKILAVGGKSNVFNDPDNRVVIARLNVNGSPDFSFGTLGVAVSPNAMAANGVLLQDDGAIVVATHTITPMRATHFAVSRFLPDGTPDGSFGSGVGALAGTVEFDLGGESSTSDAAWGLAKERDGRIIASGSGTLASGVAVFVVVRIWP